MNFLRALLGLLASRAYRVRAELRARTRFPHLKLGVGASFIVDDWRAVDIGRQVYLGSWSEIVVTRKAKQSSVEGRLVVGSNTVIGAWANIRAAGGEVEIGRNVLMGQHVSILAANHRRDELGVNPHEGKWDESRTGVRIGDGAWVGGDVLILPGVTIGARATLAAGSVITRNVPPGELWGGVPARPISRTEGSS